MTPTDAWKCSLRRNYWAPHVKPGFSASTTNGFASLPNPAKHPPRLNPAPTISERKTHETSGTWRSDIDGMADDEDSFFDDDLLADVSTNTLAQLEQKAVASTQHSFARLSTPAPVPFRKQAHNASSLNRAGALNKNLPWRPPQPTRLPLQQQQSFAASAPPASAPEPPSSDYGFDDSEDVIDLDEPSMVIQSAAQESAPPIANGSRIRQKAPLDPDTEAAFAAADAELGSQTFGRWERPLPTQPSQVDSPTASMDVSVLQRRIAELEAEQSRLRKSEEQARIEVRAKQGEIAIVRSNQDKLTKQYEARISVMQRIHADEATKAKAELEAQRKEREKMETNNRFLQHDLAQEAERAKRLNGPSRPRAASSGVQKQTPRKSKRQILGDGFDDDEIHMVSPSKSKDRSRDGTPRAGAKRKRVANDSPAGGALFFAQSPQPLRHENSEQTTASFDQVPSEPSLAHVDDDYEYVQLILNRSPYEGHKRTVEALSNYTFPSKPKKSLSSIFIDGITSSTRVAGSLTLQVCRVLLDMWRHCLEEQVFDAFYLILDMLRFALQSELATVKAQIIEQAVPLCSTCLEMVPVTLGRASKNRTYAANLDRKALDKVADDLRQDEIVSFLHDLCDASSLSAERNEVFWGVLELHAVSILLRKSSPMDHILATLQMLATSVRPLTFGVVAADAAKQGDHERAIIDSLTNWLFQVPDVPDAEDAYTEDELLSLRIEVLLVLREICQTDHGTVRLAQHRSAIGRLVRFLDTQVGRLYCVRPSVGRICEQPTTYDLIAKSVNLAMRVLYHLLKLFDNPTDITQKLSAQIGGYHRYIVSLTRIALREELVFEVGIDAEVSEAAHAILDNFLSPEDGEAVVQAFETPRGTKGTLSQRAATSGGSQDGDVAMREPG